LPLILAVFLAESGVGYFTLLRSRGFLQYVNSTLHLMEQTLCSVYDDLPRINEPANLSGVVTLT